MAKKIVQTMLDEDEYEKLRIASKKVARPSRMLPEKRLWSEVKKSQEYSQTLLSSS